MNEEARRQLEELHKMYFEFEEQYRNVFLAQIEDTVFFYRSLGRAEYRKIMGDEDLSDYEKQDVVCEVCTLWPENYDFDNCSAGIPDRLFELIIKNSFLDSQSSGKKVLSYYRQEMFEIDHQVTCVINEAFPQYDIEEIEQWDMEKTMKYMSRAEWKLHNLRGLEFAEGAGYEEEPQQAPPQQAAPQGTQKAQAQPDRSSNLRGGEKERMTPEKLEEMRRMQEKFPEINFFGDTIMNEGVEGMADGVDTTAPALRPGF